MTSDEPREIVRAWQASAFSQDTMLELFRKGDHDPQSGLDDWGINIVAGLGCQILPDGRSNSEEVALLASKAQAAAEPSGEVVTS